MKHVDFIHAATLQLSTDGQAPDRLLVVYAEVAYDRDGIVGVQRLRREDAEFVAAAWRERLARDPRAAAGLPMYQGHPDYTAGDPEEELHLVQRQPPSYGWIKDVVPGELGLELPIEWTDEGRALVESRKYRFFSPFFRSAQLGLENGRMVYAPRILRSCGLTNTPNWPQAPMVNAANQSEGAETKEQTMTLLERIGKALGKPLATEDDAVSAVDAVNAEAVRLKGVDTVNAANAETIKRLRTAYATAAVNAQVARGAVLRDHAAARVADLVNSGDSIAERVKELESLPPLMKTESTVNAEKARRSFSAYVERRQQIQDLVHAKMSSASLSYDAAFSAVRRERPELFETPNAGQ